jgi:hypothetical protein
MAVQLTMLLLELISKNLIIHKSIDHLGLVCISGMDKTGLAPADSPVLGERAIIEPERLLTF